MQPLNIFRKFDRNQNFGCVNRGNTYETCIQCNICKRPELTKKDCVWDRKGKCWIPKDIIKED